MKYFVYFIKSEKNGKIYVGSTTKNPLERAQEHNSGTNQWSRNNRPFSLKYYETYECSQDAKNRERFYKTGFGKSLKRIIVEYLEKNNIKMESK